MSKFGEFNSAQQVMRAMKKVAEDTVDKKRPSLRSAIVNSINTEEKFVMVTYVGENSEVKVPYNNIVPSYVGQYVRIGGIAGDRSVVEVMGDTDDANRIKVLEEDARQTRLVIAKFRMESDKNNLNGTIPFNQYVFPAVGGITADILGNVTLPVDGYYTILARVKTSFPQSGERYIALRVTPPGGGEYVETYDNFVFSAGDQGSPNQLGLKIDEDFYFTAGTKLRIANNAAAFIYANGSTLSIRLLREMPMYVPPAT